MSINSFSKKIKKIIKKNKIEKVIYITFNVLLILLISAFQHTPTNAGAKQLFNDFNKIGSFVFSVVLVSFSVEKLILEKNKMFNLYFSFLEKFTFALLTYEIFVLAISNVGSDIYEYGTKHPLSIFNFMFTVIILTGILMHSFRSRKTVKETNNLIGVAKEKIQTSQKDIVIIATHEIGHIMVCAACDSIDDRYYVKIDDKNENGKIGATYIPKNENAIFSKFYAEWYMLMLLGGTVAEKVFLNKKTLGSSSDYAKWMNIANSYLLNGFFGIFYDKPANEFEFENNYKKETLLLEQLKEILSEFFLENKEVFIEMRDELILNREMKHDKIKKYFERIYVPEEFPRPYW